jgi:hypothetical protein
MKITKMQPHERALLARRVGLDEGCDDASLAAAIEGWLREPSTRKVYAGDERGFITAGSTDFSALAHLPRHERIRIKARLIEAAVANKRKRERLMPAPVAAQLDPSGSYPNEWLRPQRLPRTGRVTHGGGGRVSFSP